MGLEIGIEWLTLIMFGSLLVLLMAGLPLAFVTGGLACVFLFILGDERALNIVPSRIFPLMTNYQLSAIRFVHLYGVDAGASGHHQRYVRCHLQGARGR
jgi:TRAP-type mannitol/chloroaromatic compound transport system permease large subunit